MVDKKFIGLDKPDITRFESYLPTAFSSELTLLQKVNKIIQDLNRNFDLTNEVVDYLNRFVETFDEKLYETVDDVLNVWLENSKLTDFMRELVNEEVILARGGVPTLGERLDNFDSEHAEFITQLAEKANKSQIGAPNQEQVNNWLNANPQATTTVQDGSVTMKKLAFLTLNADQGKNLFNKNTVEYDKYVSASSGSTPPTTPEDGYTASDWIRVTPLTTYTLHFPNQIAIYDLNKVYISGSTTATIQTPENGYYVRVTTLKTNLDKQQLELGSTPSYYENYAPKLTDDSIRDDSITGNKIKDKTISTNKLNFNAVEGVASKNLFNKYSVIPNAYIARSNGFVTPGDGYTASDWISVEPNTQYTLKHTNQVAFYDKNKKYISGQTEGFPQPFTTPNKVYYMRVTTLDVFLATQQLEKGLESTPYDEPYAKLPYSRIVGLPPVNPEGTGILSPSDIAREFLFTPNSVIDLWGDSRTHGEGGTGFTQDGVLIPGTDVRMSPNSHSWANSLRDLLSWKYNVTVRNYAQTGKNSLSYYEQMDTLTNQNPDVIIIMLGTNDRHNMQSVEDTKTYQRAMINLAHSKGIKVILVSPPPVSVSNDNAEIRNFGIYDLDKALSELSYEFGMKHISLYDETLKYCEFRGISPDTLSSDGLHENDEGHNLIFRNVVRALGLSYVREGVIK